MIDHRLYSCDDHLDINSVPRDLWTSRLPAKYHEAAPHVVERKDKHVWRAAGRFMGMSGRTALENALDRVHPDDAGFRASNPRLRMEDMERDGIHASIVYGPGSLFGFPIPEPEVKRLVLRAWNDWAAEEFNSYMPDRLSALPALPTSSPAHAVDELQRVLALGHRGALLAAFEVDLRDRSWDVLWAAAQEAQVPLSFHIGGGSNRLDVMADRWQVAAFAAIGPIQLDEPFAIMMFSGALERHPGLRLVLAESGVGWLPYMVARMDAVFEKHCAPDPKGLRTRPSEIFYRQVWATFEEEPLGPDLVSLLRPDNFMWACDYPHPDSTWPESHKAIEHALSNLPPEAIRKVTGENCRKLYRLP